MVRRHGGQLTHGALCDAARDVHDVDPSEYGPEDYEALREAMADHITECRWCGAEFVHGWADKFCTDQCEVDYIHEYHRD